MVAIPVQTPTRGAGVDFQTTAALWTTASVTGDTFAPSPDNFLFVWSSNTGTVTVTVTPSAGTGPLGTTYTPLALAPVVGINGYRVYGPFPSTPFQDASDGQIHISYSSTIGVRVMVANFGAI